MPWKSKADVARHNKKCAQYAECVRLWLKVANKHYKKTGNDGQAVIRANVAAKAWLKKHGKYGKRKNPGLVRRTTSNKKEIIDFNSAKLARGIVLELRSSNNALDAIETAMANLQLDDNYYSSF